MNNIITNSIQKFSFTVTLIEEQAKALQALFGYGHEALWEHAQKMGTHYMVEATNGEPLRVLGQLRDIFYHELPHQFARVDAARKAFRGESPQP